MKLSLLFSATLFLSIFLFCTCKKDNTTPLDIHLQVSPDTLVITDSETLKEIFLSTQPQGKTEFTISQKPDWLTVDPLTGTVDGKIEPVHITPLTDNLNEGIYKGKINIISDIAGTAQVYVIMSVKGHPKIKTNVSEIAFPANISETSLVIENTGTGLLNWSIDNTTNWISLSSSNGFLAKGEKSNVIVRCDRSHLDINTYTASLTITSNSETALNPLPVTMVVPKTVTMQITPNPVLFDYFTENTEVYLKNTGNSSFTWNSAFAAYYSILPNSGSLNKGDSVKIKISADRSGLQTGVYYSDIVFTNNANLRDTLKAQLNQFNNTKWILDRNIIDATFCKETNKFIIVSANPNRLSILDPDTRQTTSVSLNSTPRCLTVLSNGSLAAVGQNGFVTYVNLLTNQIDKEYPVSCNAFDIALGDNKWAYITPNEGQWTYLRCINYADGTETLHTQTGNHTIYDHTRVQLQPNTNFLYLCETTGSSSSLEKMDIQAGTANYLYEKFDANTWGNFWFSEDGQRIFTISKSVYKTSDLQANDMLYNGSIESAEILHWADHSAAADRVFVIAEGNGYSTPTSSQIDVYNGTYLNYITNYKLEQFMIPQNQNSGKLLDAEGRFVFANKTGTKIYALVQANKESGLLNDWAIQSIILR